MNEEADAIRRLLGRIDPAATLALVSAAHLTRLTEDVMSTEDVARTESTMRPASTHRHRRTWIIAGAASLAAGAAAIVLPDIVAPPSVTVLQLSTSDPLTTMCLEITPDVVAASDLAFRADVTGIDGGIVSLRVTERFAGDVGDIVRVEQGDEEPIDGAPLLFRDGGSYLVATSGTTIGSCGESGPVSPELEAIYATAFPG